MKIHIVRRSDVYHRQCRWSRLDLRAAPIARDRARLTRRKCIASISTALSKERSAGRGGRRDGKIDRRYGRSFDQTRCIRYLLRCPHHRRTSAAVRHGCRKKGADRHARTHALMHARTRALALTRASAVSEASERGRKMWNLARDETRMTGGSARESVMIRYRKEG